METVTERNLIKQFYISNDYIIVKYTEFVFFFLNQNSFPTQKKNTTIMITFKVKLMSISGYAGGIHQSLSNGNLRNPTIDNDLHRKKLYSMLFSCCMFYG